MLTSQSKLVLIYHVIFVMTESVARTLSVTLFPTVSLTRTLRAARVSGRHGDFPRLSGGELSFTHDVIISAFLYHTVKFTVVRIDSAIQNIIFLSL